MRRAILVPGSSGSLGRHLVRRLGRDGANVATLDNFSCPCDRDVPAHHAVDIADRSRVMQLPDFDVVYHLAAVSSPTAVAANPPRAFETNVLGTRNLVERFGDRVVFTHTYLGCKTLYGQQKHAAAEIVRAAGGTVVRIANVYGPGSRSVVDIFLRAAIQGRPLTVHGDGNQRCDFIHVDDAVTSLIERQPLAASGVIRSVNELAEMIVKQLGKRTKVTFDPDALIADDIEAIAASRVGRNDRLPDYIASAASFPEGCPSTASV